MIDWKELSNEIRQTLPGIRLLEEEPLARHTSFRIGGPAADLCAAVVRRGAGSAAAAAV